MRDHGGAVEGQRPAGCGDEVAGGGDRLDVFAAADEVDPGKAGARGDADARMEIDVLDVEIGPEGGRSLRPRFVLVAPCALYMILLPEVVGV